MFFCYEQHMRTWFGDWLADFLDAARALGGKLGPILYQLPPSLPYDPELLATFCASLPRKLTNVLEFRHASWFREETYTLLDQHRISLCVSDFPGCEAPLLVTAPPAYLRFHGGRSNRGNYSRPSLQTAADVLRRWRQDGIPCFAYFNNTAAAHAVTNARTLRDLTRTADCVNSA